MAVVKKRKYTLSNQLQERRQVILETARLGPYNANILTLEKIAEEVTSTTHSDIGKERVRQVLESVGEDQAFYSRVSRAKSLKKGKVASFLGVLNDYMLKKAKEQSSAHERAIKYYHAYSSGRKNGLDFESLLKLFQAYEEGQAGEKLNLMSLAYLSGMHYVTVSRILKKVGLDPLNNGRKRNSHVPQDKVKAINAAFDLRDFSSKDIGYFLSISNQSVIEKWLKRAKRGKGVTAKRIYTMKDSKLTYDSLTYARASEIYEANDLGFDNTETAQLLDLEERTVEYAKSVRKDISPKIVNALKVLYPDRRVTKPYITWRNK